MAKDVSAVLRELIAGLTDDELTKGSVADICRRLPSDLQGESARSIADHELGKERRARKITFGVRFAPEKMTLVRAALDLLELAGNKETAIEMIERVDRILD